MTRADRLRARIAELDARIGGQRMILARLGSGGRHAVLASELLMRLMEVRDAYCEALSWSEPPGR